MITLAVSSGVVATIIIIVIIALVFGVVILGDDWDWFD